MAPQVLLETQKSPNFFSISQHCYEYCNTLGWFYDIAQCLLEDYAKNRGFDRDRLLLACVQHTAVHRKYGDFLECSRRYGRTMGVASLAH